MRAYADTGPPVLGALRYACRLCSLNELCCPIGLDPSDVERLQSMVRCTGTLPAGLHLFRTGDQSTAIYALRSGCVKSYSVDAGGHEAVHGFHLRGEVLGFDAVYPDSHRCGALILEPSAVCIIPYHDVARLSVVFPNLNRQMLQLMSREFSKQLMYRECFGASRRIAAFLLDMNSRLHRPGYSDFEFRLPMSREQIANYLGISPETLSRLLANMHKQGLIDIDRRQVQLMDPIRLDSIAQGVA